MKLLNIDQNAKTVKGQKEGYKTAIMYLAPHKLAGSDINVCASASKGCIAACLNTAGHGRYSTVQQARINRTRLFKEDSVAFKVQLIAELLSFREHCSRHGFKPAVRLNGTSDILWEKQDFRAAWSGVLGGSWGKYAQRRAFKRRESIYDSQTIFQLFPDMTFYDYTKHFERMIKSLKGGDWPWNYDLTFSRTEEDSSDYKCGQVLVNGGNVAVVCSHDLPDYMGFVDGHLTTGPTFDWRTGFQVIDGDVNDLRFLEDAGVIVGLRAKGKAKHDKTGFVLSTKED